MGRNSKSNNHGTKGSNNDEEKGSVTRCVCKEQHTNGLMIQCDTCKVWQHCSCVGIPNQNACPNVYFCELCRKNELKSTKKEKNKDNESWVLPPPVKKNETNKLGVRRSERRKILSPEPSKESTDGLDSTSSNTKTKRSERKAQKLDEEEERVNEFTTRAGRRITRVSYVKSSDEENNSKPALLKDAPAKTNPPSPTLKLTRKPKKTAVFESVDREINKSKTKTVRKPYSPQLSPDMNATSEEDTSIPALLLNLDTTPIPPHEVASPTSEGETPIASPIIQPSKLPLPKGLSSEISSPPPKPKTVSSKMTIKDMVKRATYIKECSSTIYEQIEEHLETTKAKRKNYKKNYLTSIKLSKHLAKDCNSFLELLKETEENK